MLGLHRKDKFSPPRELRVQVRLSEVIAALSYALDLTEGQPQGHAARSCVLGMRLARDLRLPVADSSALFYALLMKDVGCSANASALAATFGADERSAKAAFKYVDWTRFFQTTRYAWQSAAPGGTLLQKLGKLAPIALKGYKAGTREMIQIRCERGASIARSLQLPPATTDAILGLDEHWDGSGHPQGLRGENIPLLSRVLNLAQSFEVFGKKSGIEAAFEMADQRSGSWFDPNLVRILHTLKGDTAFWERYLGEEPRRSVIGFEPADRELFADGATLDRIAHGFAQVIDAKSPWTFKHSEGVANIAAGLASVMGLPASEIQRIHRAGLLHDIGKLGISNLILDKPGRLNDQELAEMKKHPGYTHQLLKQVAGFADLAELAASHHEKLDGSGYHRGLTAAQLSTPDRILCVADMYEALSAKRPYRAELSREEIFAILSKSAGTGICPEVFAALKTWVAGAGAAQTPAVHEPRAAA
jgi:HD-GYP domain-containing protein (c-di-GMP phosphodiesterase class II)